MQIQSIHQQNNFYNPTFKVWTRTVFKPGAFCGIENVTRRNDTYFCRNMDFWMDLVNFLSKKFKNSNSIHIYSYGCSDGSDPLTLLMALFSGKNKDLIKKISTITAKDCDPIAISRAKTQQYEMSYREKNEINIMTENKYHYFFTESYSPTLARNSYVTVNPEVSKYIKFDVGNILFDYKKILPANSVVLLRNILPYLNKNLETPFLQNENDSWSFQKDFLKKLYRHLGDNSYIAIGEYDRYEMGKQLPKMLEEAGFEQTEVYNLYRRVPLKEREAKKSAFKKVLQIFQKVCN